MENKAFNKEFNKAKEVFSAASYCSYKKHKEFDLETLVEFAKKQAEKKFELAKQLLDFWNSDEAKTMAMELLSLKKEESNEEQPKKKIVIKVKSKHTNS